MSSPSTPRDYTAQHPPTDQAEQQQQQHGSQGRFPAPDPTASSQQPRQWLNRHPQDPTPDASSRQDQILDAQSSSPFASSAPTQTHERTSNINPQSPSSEDLTTLTQNLKSSLRQYPDFPSKGILFEDILPLFSSPSLHSTLISALQSFIRTSFPTSSSDLHTSTTNTSSNPQQPQVQQGNPSSSIPSTNVPFDYILALESRGFLFGPTLAHLFDVGFVPVRKPGKLPGKTEKAGFGKEYGDDGFEVQADALSRHGNGQKRRVLVLDDILATGGSAAAAGELVERIGGTVVGYVFLLELEQLKGREKLGKPVHTLMATKQEEKVS